MTRYPLLIHSRGSRCIGAWLWPYRLRVLLYWRFWSTWQWWQYGHADGLSRGIMVSCRWATMELTWFPKGYAAAVGKPGVSSRNLP